jgi:AcrR family transcriptional regulator
MAMARSSEGRRSSGGTARPRPVGRPARGADAEDVRRRLLEVARELFAQRAFGEVGIREIARAARVTPGMIAYYFDGKQGLYEAMLSEAFEQILTRVRALVADPPPGLAPLAALVRIYVATISSHPWLPALILREVVTGSPAVRARFIERFASRAAALLPPLIQAEIDSGELRAGVDPKLAVLSIAGMVLFPYLAHPVTGRVLDYQLDEAFARHLLEHTTRLLLDGLRARPEAS